MVRTLLAAAAVLALVPAAIAQQDCPRGSLDTGFCDRDGDMVADVPSDPSEQVDPPILTFAYPPVEDTAVYFGVWDGFLEHLARVTGKRTELFQVQSNADQIEAMRAGRLHIAGFNTGSNPIAVNCAGNVPFAMMTSRWGEYGYSMLLIAHVDGPVMEPEDIKGRILAFTEPTSNSGFKVPSALLREEFGMEPDKDYKTAFSGKHDNSILGVANKDYDAAAVASEVMVRIFRRGALERSLIRVIYESEPFPTTGYGHAHNLKPELAAKVREAFFSFVWDGSALAMEFGNAIPPMEQFVPITYQEHWDAVRRYDELAGVKYECKN